MVELRCSVVIPARNAAHVIGQQLDALATQVRPPAFEVVIADNGSTDDLSGAMSTRRRKEFLALRIVDASRGPGVSVARNVGIGAAATDRILICDADDRVGPSWVESLNRGLDLHPLVSGPLETRQLSGDSAEWAPIPQRMESLFHTWQGRTYGIGASMGMRREVWRETGGFDETYPAGAEEIDFAWRAADLGFEFGFVPEALLHYRIRPDLRGLLRQQYNSGRGLSRLYWRFRPSEVTAKSAARRLAHELTLLRRFPWRGTRSERRSWAVMIAFEAGKLCEARKLGISAP